MKKIQALLITAILVCAFLATAQPQAAAQPKTAAEPKETPNAQKLQRPAKQSKWKASPIPGWLIHYDEAIRAAKKANKHIFVLNAGSDWDPVSVSLRKSVLDTRDFQQIAKRSLILLYLDSPQKFPMPEEQTRHHDIIREKLQLKGKKVQTAVIIDADGKILCEISGVLPKNEYLDKIRAAIADDTTGK